MSKLLVTGGAGFIGSHLTDRLIELGHKVVVVDNLSLGKEEFVNKQAIFEKTDICSLETLERLFVGIDAVFHLAADPRLQISIDEPLQAHNTNVNGTLNVLLAAKKAGVKKVIFSSSCTAVGEHQPPVKESVVPKPVSPYGLHKLIGEQYSRLFNQLYGLETVCLRYFNVYGPRKLATGSYPMVIPVFLQQRKDSRNLTVVGDGEATRDYVHVSDVVEANVKAWQSDVVDGTPINIGTGKQISVNTIATLIKGDVEHITPRQGEMRYVEADITRAKELLSWQPVKNFEEGIAELKHEWGVE